MMSCDDVRGHMRKHFRTKFCTLDTSFIEICWVVYMDLNRAEGLARGGELDHHPRSEKGSNRFSCLTIYFSTDATNLIIQK